MILHLLISPLYSLLKQHKQFFLLLFITVPFTMHSQTCTEYISNIQVLESDTITVQKGHTLCFDKNVSFGFFQMKDSSNIVIESGINVNAQYQNSILNNQTFIWVKPFASLNFSLALDGTKLGNVNKFKIEGNAVYNYPVTLLGNTEIELGTIGQLHVGANGDGELGFASQDYSNIYNNGQLFFNSINFSNQNNNLVKYTFVNDSFIDFKGYAAFGDSHIFVQNKQNGVVTFEQGFSSSPNIVMTNCGTINFYGAFTLNGGAVYNTNTINHNVTSFDFVPGATETIINYGYFNFTPENPIYISMEADDVFYNEGTLHLNNTYFSSGILSGPEQTGKQGYVELTAEANKHTLAKIIGNIDIKNTSGASTVEAIFWTPPVMDPTVTFDCASTGTCTAPPVTSIPGCLNLDGSKIKELIRINPHIF